MTHEHKRLRRAVEKGDEWTCATRVIMMPKDANMYGIIFGGVVLSHIDLSALVEARYHGLHKWVTASMEKVDFLRPIRIGDIVSFYTKTVKTGTKSVTVEVCVEVSRYDTNEIEEVTTADLTMVSVNNDGVPIPFDSPSTLNW